MIGINFSCFMTQTKTKIVMGNLLYLIAVVLVILWLLGYFVYPLGGGIIHILLVIAIIAVLFRVIGGNRRYN